MPIRRPLLLVLTLALARPAAGADPRLSAGGATLAFPAGRGVAVGPYATDTPAVVNLADGATVAAGYDRVTVADDHATATAAVVTPYGSRFAFTDRWTATADGGFALARRVTVVAADGRDEGFDTRFGLRVPGAKSVRDVELFAPGVWYGHNDHAVHRAIGADPGLAEYLIKETRLAMPIVMARPAAGGPAVSIAHADARPRTGLSDREVRPQTHPSIQYASLGFYGPDTVGLCYPGTEGTVSYGSPGPRRRYHPVRAGVPHSYDLTVRLGPAGADFPAAMTDAWRRAVAADPPAVRPAPAAAVYRDGLAVFDQYYRDDFAGGGRGLPFMVWLGLHPPRGRDRNPANPASGRGASEYHLQSGFVGAQIPAAYLMLRQGLIGGRRDEVDRWASVVDFWVDHSLTPAGVPRTDYSCERAEWDAGPAYLRTLADGTEGVVDAYRVALVHGHRRDTWLAYGRTVGDFLCRAQHADGTWARSYNADGTPAHPAAFNTSNPLRLLAKLSVVTGDRKYLAAAARAGHWCLAHVDRGSAYVGGTPDNDNTIDKEAGVLAFYGFQSLYDATGDKRWLAAAARAADYAETWTYAWSFPARPPPGLLPGVRSPWPACGLVGQSLVATGHSYVDMFMVGCSTAYYRLALQTGDDHYRDVARLLADGANRPADVSGGLGYPMRGLVEEGVGPADFVAAGPGTCLTWCTHAQVRPVADLQDLFGCDRVDDAERRWPPAVRAAKNADWYPVR